MAKPKTVIGEKLKKALETPDHDTRNRDGGPKPRKKAPAQKPAVDATPPGYIRSFAELKAGDLIVAEYPLDPGRLAGHFGAHVVSLSKDGKDAAVKFLFPTKPPRAGSLHQTDHHGFMDAGDERYVTIRRPSFEEHKKLKEMIAPTGSFNIQLKVGDMVAMVYPKPGRNDEWDAGVAVGQVVRADGKEYGVAMFFPEYLDDEEMDPEPVAALLYENGEYIDTDFGCTLAMVRKATPAETAEFTELRNEVTSRKAIPNMKPKKGGK